MAVILAQQRCTQQRVASSFMHLRSCVLHIIRTHRRQIRAAINVLHFSAKQQIVGAIYLPQPLILNKVGTWIYKGFQIFNTLGLGRYLTS